MERASGIEPNSSEWNSKALPTTTRINKSSLTLPHLCEHLYFLNYT